MPEYAARTLVVRIKEYIDSVLCVAVPFLLIFVLFFVSNAFARPHLFNTVEFQMTLASQKNWLGVMERNSRHPIFIDAQKLTHTLTWGELKAKAETLSILEKLRLVNQFWNRWPYRTDKELYHKDDYWAAPYEFLERSGDCEDYSIVKYYTLKELGVSIDDMRIVVVRETIRNIGHAVLAVYCGEEIYILDNLSDAVRSSYRIRNYIPQYSVNEKHRWVYVKSSTGKNK